MAARIRLIAIVHAFELQFLDKFLFFKQAETVVYRGQTDRGNLLARFAVDIKSAGMTLVIDEFGYDHQTLGRELQTGFPQAGDNGILELVSVNSQTP